MTDVKALPAKWREESEKLRSVAIRAQKRGDMEAMYNALAAAEDAKGYANELESALAASAPHEATNTCQCGAPCRKEVLMRGGDNGWGDDASRTVLRYVPPPTHEAQQAGGEAAPLGFIRWLDEDFEIDWLRDHTDGDCFIYTTPPSPDTAALVEAIDKSGTGRPMSLRVALDFADNPRPYHSLACPADTNGELYKALRVLAAELRALTKPAKESSDDDER